MTLLGSGTRIGSARTGGTVLGAALAGDAVSIRHADGHTEPLLSDRWLGPARGADMTLLERVTGPALDVGCGPGRLVAALAGRGVPALGIDIDPMAVRLASDAGCASLRRSVFDPLPAEGRWLDVLLADGNIGIGGDPVRLLRRVAEPLCSDGQALVEVGPPGQGAETGEVRLEHSASYTRWFHWSRVGSDALPELAAAARLSVAETWSAPDGGASIRWFVTLTKKGAAAGMTKRTPVEEPLASGARLRL